MTSESVSNHFERCETEKYLRRKISMLGELESKELALHDNRVGCFCSTYAGQLWIIDIVVRIRKEGRKRYEKLALGPPALINGVWTVEAPSRGIINSSLVGSVSIHGGKRPGNSSTTRRRSLDPFSNLVAPLRTGGEGEKREKSGWTVNILSMDLSMVVRIIIKLEFFLVLSCVTSSLSFLLFGRSS